MASVRCTLTLPLAAVVCVLVVTGVAATPGVAAGESLAATVAQDSSAVEASLALDRSTRRLIQQGLRNEGFDPGTPDGRFGLRTCAAAAVAGSLTDGVPEPRRSGASSNGRTAATGAGSSPAARRGCRRRPEHLLGRGSTRFQVGGDRLHSGVASHRYRRRSRPAERRRDETHGREPAPAAATEPSNCHLRSSLTATFCGRNGFSPAATPPPPSSRRRPSGGGLTRHGDAPKRNAGAPHAAPPGTCFPAGRRDAGGVCGGGDDGGGRPREEQPVHGSAAGAPGAAAGDLRWCARWPWWRVSSCPCCRRQSSSTDLLLSSLGNGRPFSTTTRPPVLFSGCGTNTVDARTRVPTLWIPTRPPPTGLHWPVSGAESTLHPPPEGARTPSRSLSTVTAQPFPIRRRAVADRFG